MYKTSDYNYQFIQGYIKKHKYRKMSQKEEIEFIKKAKLSFYDDVSEEEKTKYLEYYMEMFPKFKEEYDKYEDEELLDSAIEKSKYYRDKYLEKHQRLVLKEALGYVKKCHSLSLLELIDEGNIGMLIALKKFDVEKGVKFSTYAFSWIKQLMSNAIVKNDRMIRIPAQHSDNLKKLNRIERELYFSLERTPTVEELANYSGLTVKQVDMLRDYYENKRLPESLDAPFFGDEVDTVGDFVQSDEVDFAEMIENEIVVSECLDYLKSKLPSEYVDVLMKRYGLEDGVSYSYNKIAEQMGMSLKEVRKIDYYNRKVLCKKIKGEKYYGSRC